MDVIRFGRSIAAIRRRKHLRQQDLGDAAGVSRSLVSRIERGRVAGVPFATLRKVGTSLGADVELTIKWHGEGLDRLLDEAHAAIVDEVVRRLRAAGWEVAVEVSFSIDGERGSIDVMGWHPQSEVVLISEVKSVVPDGQATVFGLDRKARLAPLIAGERGWTCRGVARVLFVGEGRTARRRVERHEAMFSAAFPVRGRAVLDWLRRPTLPGIAGLVFLRIAGAAEDSSNSRSVSVGRGGPWRARVSGAGSKRGAAPTRTGDSSHVSRGEHRPIRE